MKEEDFKRYLGTNYVPNDDEIIHVQRIIFTKEKELSQIETSVVPAEESNAVPTLTHIVELSPNRVKLQGEIQAYKALLTPIRRVLPEILSEIFIHCLPDDHIPKPSVREAPILLGRICRSWRKIAYSTPQLWAALEFQGSFLWRHNATVLKEWLDKSGTLPITFRLVDLYRREYSSVEMWSQRIEAIVEALSAYSRRWRSIALGSRNLHRPFPGLHHLLSSLSGGVPVLQDLDLRVLFPENLSVIDLGSLKKLETLSLHSPTTRNLTTSFGENQFSNLRHVFLELHMSLDDFLIHLSHFPYLEDLVLVTHNWQPLTISQHPQVVTLKHLTKLFIRFGNHEREPDYDPGPLFDHLYMPSLLEFGVHLLRCDQMQDWFHIARLFERSQSDLQSLWLHGSPMTYDAVMECLKFTPKLSLLSLSHIIPNSLSQFSEFMDALTPTPALPGNSCICPKLEGLEMRYCASYSEPLVQFLRGRLNDSFYSSEDGYGIGAKNKYEPGSGRLRSMHLAETSMKFIGKLDGEFDSCVEQGLDLVLDDTL